MSERCSVTITVNLSVGDLLLLIQQDASDAWVRNLAGRILQMLLDERDESQRDAIIAGEKGEAA